jgi:hypothetical protein
MILLAESINVPLRMTNTLIIQGKYYDNSNNGCAS